MAKKKAKKLTLAEMKNRLWDAFVSDGNEYHDALNEEAEKLLDQLPDMEIPAFKVTAGDLQTIRIEVEGSCLDASSKKAFLAAIKAAKSVE